MKYLYKCGNCKEVQEIEKGMTAPHPTLCRCGGELQHIFTPVSAIYRVSGFYSVDKRVTPVHPLDYDPQVH